MKSNGLPVIARKELRDHFRSRKFLLIFGIFLIITIIGMVSGAAQYNKDLQSYNDRQSVADDDEYSMGFGWGKPSIMSIYLGVSGLIVTLGAILGIAMGFDLISKEKETKSLKILLSHPVYRDEVINGKALGGLMALAIALGITFIVTFAILLISGIVPEGDELSKILVYGGAAFLMILSYFALSLFMSTVANDSGKALVYTLVIFVALMSMPMLLNGPVMNMIIGEPPEYPEEAICSNTGYSSMKVEYSVSSGDGVFEEPKPDPVWEEYQKRSDEYWNKRQSVSDFITLISPTMNLQTISYKLLIPDYSRMMSMAFSSAEHDGSEMPETDVFADIFKNIIALFAFPALFLGLAYVRFMRMDIR
ncbi:ABC transporter permease [Methanogenium sp. MK-MG]|uniref:ABC transporter permease n=1 Tax=Methanogenium sp. MK-MG TaxID=2599926 RepID=UPI0013EDB866|nr:ABC transporter permease subunit [Methanogenium sp. MK-MG]KAF1077244.1 hypothetical protein MKMG_01323 [Methanogenium sp. MK-MG]